MKISFITTVLNEEKTIDDFIKSIFRQSRKPDEIIIVDGESSDQTLAKIKNYGRKLKLLIKKGNRAVGRNEAIRKAIGDIILCSDAGCTLDKNWVKEITKPFKDQEIDVVSGYYHPIVNNIFEKCLATYTCVMSDKVDPNNFLPSSRSVAFKKKAWKEVDGYPEYLDTCEDLTFALRAKKIGLKFKFARGAIVYWPQRKNIKEAFIQFFRYAKGDGRAHFVRFNTYFLFLRYSLAFLFFLLILFSKQYELFIIIFSLLLLYIVWTIFKNYKYVNKWQALYFLPLLQFVSDIAVVAGTAAGLLGI